MQYIRKIHNPKPTNLMNRKEPKCVPVPQCDSVPRDKKIEPVPLKDLPLTNEIVTPELLEQQLNNLSGTLSNDIAKPLESLIQTLSALFPKYVPLSGNVTIGGNLSVTRDLYHVQGKTVKPYVYDIVSNLTRFNTNSQVVGAKCLYDTLSTLSFETNQKIEGVMEDVSRIDNNLDSLASNVANEFANIDSQFEQVESKFSQVNSNIESVRAIATDAKQQADLANSSISSLADVARSGSYNDLKDKPVIPSDPPVSSVNGQTGDVNLDAHNVSAVSLDEAKQGFTDWIVTGLSEDERILIYPRWQSPNRWSLVTSVKQYNAIGLNDAVNLTFLNSSVTAARVKLRPTPEQEELWNQKQDALIFDSKPILDSLNPVTSNGVAVALSGVAENLDNISAEIANITTELSNKADASALNGKVDANSEGKVEVNRVVTNSIEDDAVTSAKIQNGAIVLEKLSQDVIDKINSAVSGITGNLAGFDQNGKLCDSGINESIFNEKADRNWVESRLSGKADSAWVNEELGKKADSDAVESELNNKIDKITSAISGNIALFNENGNLTDSQKAISSFATSEQGVRADNAISSVNGKTSVTGVVTLNAADISALANSGSVVLNGNLTISDPEGGTEAVEYKHNGFAVYANNGVHEVSLPLSAGRLALESQLSTVQTSVSGVTGNFAGFDENGNLCDLGINASAFASLSALENLTDDMRSLRDSVVENIRNISSVLSNKTDLTTTSNLSIDLQRQIWELSSYHRDGTTTPLTLDPRKSYVMTDGTTLSLEHENQTGPATVRICAYDADINEIPYNESAPRTIDGIISACTTTQYVDNAVTEISSQTVTAARFDETISSVTAAINSVPTKEYVDSTVSSSVSDMVSRAFFDQTMSQLMGVINELSAKLQVIINDTHGE